MSTCQYCGEEIEWRTTIDGRAVPIHPNGGWECSGQRLDADRERSCWRTKCPQCGAAPVYFVRHNGGSVWFDELGQPWPIHGCFAEEPASVSLAKIRSAAAGIDCHPILGAVVTIKTIGSQTGVAVELFNGRKACFAVADCPTLTTGSPVAVFRDAETTKEQMLTELNVRFTILRHVAAASLGLAPNWADCHSYDDIEAPNEALLLTYTELLRLHDDKPKEFAELARLFNLKDDKQEEAREKFRRRHQYAGKIICAARTAWEQLRSRRGNRQSFPDYFEALTGRCPSKRGQSCAKAYRQLVLTGRISEEDYDIHSSEAIQMASRVIARIGDDLNAPAIVEVATILRGRSRATLRELRALLARLHEDVASGQVVLRHAGHEGIGRTPMSFADAVRHVTSIVEAGHHGAMIEGLVALAGSTTNDQIASELAGASSRIRAALKKADGAGRQRFADAAIDEGVPPARSVQFITVDSLKAEHVAAVRKAKDLADKLAAAGVQVTQ